LDPPQRRDEAPREAQVADREVLHRALRLRAPQRVLRHAHLAQRVPLDPVLFRIRPIHAPGPPIPSLRCQPMSCTRGPPYVRGGCDGRISIRLGSARGGNSSRSVTTRATSSAWRRQSAPAPRSRPLNSVLTLPGITWLTRIPA